MSRRDSYPISMLFLSVSVAAFLVRLGLFAAAPTEDRIIAAIAGGSLGLFLGVVMGFHTFRRLRGVVFGGFAGAIIGGMLSPLALVPPEAIAAVLLFEFMGGGILAFVVLLLWRQNVRQNG